MHQYTIPFAGLAKGNHQFEFTVDDTFFELFEQSVIEHATIRVDLDLLKAETSLTLTFVLKGIITAPCDRCLGPVEIPVDQVQVLLVRFGTSGSADADDTVVLDHDAHQINVAQHLYDYLSLALPMRVVHPDTPEGQPGCDPEFLKRLLDASPEPHTDPRWEVLKKLGLN